MLDLRASPNSRYLSASARNWSRGGTVTSTAVRHLTVVVQDESLSSAISPKQSSYYSTVNVFWPPLKPRDTST